jgi:hypothetical protein
MRVRLILAASALLAVGMLAGCGQQDSGQKNPNPKPPQVVTQPKPTPRVELMPDDSDEYLRRHFTNANGVEVETQIEYRNGDKADVKYRADGSQLSYNRTAKDGSVVADKTFAADGKTIVSGREVREDKTLKWTASQDANGVVTMVTYWWDGKTVFANTVTQPNGSYEATYFRKDGSLWMKRMGAQTGTVDREQSFDNSGKLAFTLEHTPQDIVATLYRADGTVLYKQHMTERKSGYGNYVNRTMLFVEEYAADGKTVERKLVMDSSGYSVDSVERPQSDGTTLVRSLNSSGAVVHEARRDANGNIVSQRDITPADGIKEPYEWRSVRTPSSDDPVNSWDMAEKYPYYRR